MPKRRGAHKGIVGRKQIEVRKAELNPTLSTSLSPRSITFSPLQSPGSCEHGFARLRQHRLPSARLEGQLSLRKGLMGLCWPRKMDRESHSDLGVKGLPFPQQIPKPSFKTKGKRKR